MNIKDPLIMRVFLLLLVLCGLPLESFSYDFYLGDETRLVDVYSKSPTLVVFPAPVMASSCQPEGTVDFFKVNEVNELYDSSADLNSLNELKNSKLDLFLKLVPLQVNGTARCSFSLQNGSNVHLDLRLKETLYRPILKIKEFQSSVCLQEETKVQNIFIELIQGRPQRFFDVTPSLHLRRSDPQGSYKIIYVGRYEDIKGAIIEMKVDKSMVVPQRLVNVGVGEIYYSTIIKDKRNAYHTTGSDTLKMVLLVRADLSTEDILSKLPVLEGEKNEK